MKNLVLLAALTLSTSAFAFIPKTVSCDYMVTVYTEVNNELTASFVNVLLPSRDGNLAGGYSSATQVKMKKNVNHTLITYSTKNGNVLLVIEKDKYTVLENHKGQQLAETRACHPSLNSLY